MASCSFCDSRAELVDRAIDLDAENRHLRRALLEMQSQRGEEANASYVTLLLHRIAALEANVEKMAKRSGKKAA